MHKLKNVRKFIRYAYVLRTKWLHCVRNIDFQPSKSVMTYALLEGAKDFPLHVISAANDKNGMQFNLSKIKHHAILHRGTYSM